MIAGLILDEPIAKTISQDFEHGNSGFDMFPMEIP
jgi:hypothetical protein